MRREFIWMVHGHAKSCKHRRLLQLDTKRLIRLTEERLKALAAYRNSLCRPDRHRGTLLDKVKPYFSAKMTAFLPRSSLSHDRLQPQEHNRRWVSTGLHLMLTGRPPHHLHYKAALACPGGYLMSCQPEIHKRFAELPKAAYQVISCRQCRADRTCPDVLKGAVDDYVMLQRLEGTPEMGRSPAACRCDSLRGLVGQA